MVSSELKDSHTMDLGVTYESRGDNDDDGTELEKHHPATAPRAHIIAPTLSSFSSDDKDEQAEMAAAAAPGRKMTRVTTLSNANPQQDPEPDSLVPDAAHTDSQVTATEACIDQEETMLPLCNNSKFLEQHCWGCHTWIYHPGRWLAAKDESRLCFSALHLHPLMDVPVCVVCCEDVEEVERNFQQKQQQGIANPPIRSTMDMLSSNEKSKKKADLYACACSACGKLQSNELGVDQKREHDFLVCRICSREICQQCFQQALGGEGQADKNHQDGNGIGKPIPGEWRCFYCPCGDEESYNRCNAGTSTSNLPAFLQQLQTRTRELFSTNSRKKIAVQPINEALGEMEQLEFELKSCERKLEEEDELLRTIRNELSTEIGNDGEQVLFLEQRILDVHTEWIYHQRRLLDRIAILGDKFRSDHGFDAHRWMKSKKHLSSEVTARDEEEGEEPLWKVSADKAITKREREENRAWKDEQRELFRKHTRHKFGFDSESNVLSPEDWVEDLGSSSEAEDEDSLSGESDSQSDFFDLGWRNAPFRASKLEIAKAKQLEDRRRLEGRTTVRVIECSKRDDEREFRAWENGLKSSMTEIPYESSSVDSRLDLEETSSNNHHATGTPQTEKYFTPSHATSGGDQSMSTAHVSIFAGRLKNRRGLRPSLLVLSKDPPISIDGRIERHLKEHQRDGIQFMFRNSFADLVRDDVSIPIGGCILAHSMGLVMLHPLLIDSVTQRARIFKVLLVVPVNTIMNWENEFWKWTGKIQERANLFNASTEAISGRYKVVEAWSNQGGVLLVSDALFRSMAQNQIIEKFLIDSDAIVLDEGHKMLKNTDSLIFKALMKINTKRRICLTGTPFQNNLMEYYRMISFIRPKLLGNSETSFQKEWIDPIQAGMGRDAPEDTKVMADSRLEFLFEKLKPHVHRKDATLLAKDLPPLQQVCLHLRPTKLQRCLYRAYNEYKSATDDTNFFRQFSSLRSVHNHPATLLSQPQHEKRIRSMTKKRDTLYHNIKLYQKGISNSGSKPETSLLSSDEDDDDSRCDTKVSHKCWWTNTAMKFGIHNMKNPESELGEKTVVFSQSLKTLDFLSTTLASKNWKELCPSLQESFPDMKIGGWVLGKDFLRLDGTTSPTERRDRLNDFSWEKRIKLFLISSEAGGIGINIVAANRVVLFDSHFNPSIDLQAISRCYRYGQKRSVFAYRLLTQGSMEERVYSKAVNKIGLGNRVIDGKELHRFFSTDEIDSLARDNDWVECIRCKQWRMFPPDHTANVAKLPKEWVCEMMNEYDARMELTCSFKEKDSEWYYHHFKKPNKKVLSRTSHTAEAVIRETTNVISAAQSEIKVDRDVILKKLVTLFTRGKNAARIVTKHYFHEALFSDASTRTNASRTNREHPASDTEIFKDR